MAQRKYSRTSKTARPSRQPALHQLSDEQLTQHLMKIVLGTFVFLVVILGSLMFFAPKLGAFFGLLSFRRNDNNKTVVVAPASPVFSDIPPSTKSENLTLNGFTEPGMTIKLFVNGPEAQSTISDNEGLFTFIDVKLIEGNNKIFAKAVNEQGAESDASIIVSILLDNKAPDVSIDTPTNGETVRNLNKRVLVKGTVSELSTVRVNGNLAVQKSDNTYEIVIGAEEGDLEIKVEATDEAGNTKTEKIFIKYAKGS
ncbi:hypothetical protein A2976_01535 [candidate division WWE3 bacterium RIFCSPLOWO2_01_FULL_41_9]|uniref:Bacterial Ig-like domain-containing protein n=4 Tax=Katanobacteria TaxID=422282 RepID=A0A1F4VHQ0_UNCKA|nr:MAG: hypothetical protein A2976_01535 [candidate division WWE3 bacterium RIFCSPLOWO2_01_FULL_41_9]